MTDPAEDIMGATYRALCDHGYADLTMRDIAEESDRSKAALHYHYDDREGLLCAFLEHLYESFLETVAQHAPPAVLEAARARAAGDAGSTGGERAADAIGEDAAQAPDDVAAAVDGPIEDPDARLRAFLDDVLHPPRPGDPRAFRTALLEIKAQAPYVPAFRDRLARFDAVVDDTVRALVRAGQEQGVYDADADPEHVARFVLVVLDGAGARHVVADAPVDCAVASLEDYLDAHLLTDAGAAARADAGDGPGDASGGSPP